MKWILNILNALADWMIVNRAESIFNRQMWELDDSYERGDISRAIRIAAEIGNAVDLANVVSNEKQLSRIYDMFDAGREMHEHLCMERSWMNQDI